jgi:pimeloyl-ACP methyl ester carboxylesterase
MSHVQTKDNVRLRYKDWGTGRAVVMMHGWPLSSDTFDDLGMAIANAGMRAISYDRRGFGRSQQPWGGYDYDTLADDLAAVIEHTGARDVTLLGFSMGGGEVARYLTRHGATNIRSAILMASIVPYMLKTADNPKGTDQSVFDGVAKGIAADRAAFWATFFKSFYGVRLMAHPVSQAVLDWSCDLSMQASLPATLGCAKAFATTDLRPDLKSFTVPTLIIHGTADETVPIDASARAAAKGIPNSKLIEYDGGPHGLLASHKDQVTKDVLEFLKR